jgi:hypothetical protein
MLFRKDVFTEIELSIKGYQFPHLAKDWNDGNWLNVNVQVKHPKGNWQKTDPCLETFELKWLIEWLEKIAENGEVENHLYFIEPCLEFEFIKGEENKIRVSLSYEFSPPWIKDFEEDFFIDFAITEKELKRAISDLRKELETFPIRGKSINE